MLRSEIQSIYNRQVAKCLSDIEEVHTLPAVVETRIKLAIEFTCKDVDKLRLKTRNPNGEKTNGQQQDMRHDGNR